MKCRTRFCRCNMPGVVRWVMLCALMLSHAMVAWPANFQVDTTTDENLPVCASSAGDCSLRGAITTANAIPGVDTISFAIAGTGVKTITVLSSLPAITESVIIDGFSQSGAIANTNVSGTLNGILTVELRGPAANGSAIRVNANDSVIRGLVINRFSNSTGVILSGNNNRVEGCYIGTNAAGTAGFVSSGSNISNSSGISVSGTGNIIGGTTARARNLISANKLEGVSIFGSAGTAGNNLVQGNLIGTDKSGNVALGNGRNGIDISGVSNNTIGGATVSQRNVISGNQAGLFIFTSNNIVQGNYIGVGADGTTALGNSGLGIYLQTGSSNLIGGAAASKGQPRGNVISNNGAGGIATNGANSTRIQGNIIGLNAAGSAVAPNLGSGIFLLSNNNIIGGLNPDQGNIISGNGTVALPQTGIVLNGDNNVAQRNLIGIGANGTTPLGNTGHGVFINSQDNNFIGTSAAQNSIANNGGDGVRVNEFNGSGVGNSLQFNSIFNNGRLGINLVSGSNENVDGVTPNDPGDGDGGPNLSQNYPVITSTRIEPSGMRVRGFLNSAPNTTFTIVFYDNPPDPSIVYEGRRLLTYQNITTGSDGMATIDVGLSPALTVGNRLTTTATNLSNNNTSEFSEAVTVTNVPDISINDIAVVEGAPSTVTDGTFTVTLSILPTTTVKVDYATTNGTAAAPTDYTAVNGTLTFAPGERSKTITMSTVGDALDESNETFFVNLSNATGGNITDTQGKGTITDDDPPPALSIGDVSITEPDTGTVNLLFNVTLSAVSAKSVRVDYLTQNGSAAAPADYAALPVTTLIIPAGQTTATINVPINGDTIVEADETFFINLGAPVNAMISDSSAVGLILNDDSATMPSLSINDVTIVEGTGLDKNALFTVTLSEPSAETVKVDAISANGTAKSPSDFNANGQSLTFAPGQITKTFSVPVIGDALDEDNETLFVILSGAINASILRGRGTGTIADNDATPSITIEDVNIGEGDSGQRIATFNLRLSAPSGRLVKVSYATAAGTATSTNDYVHVPATQIAFTTGQAIALARVQINGDTLKELDETFKVNLSLPVNATIADTQAIGTILNDDNAPALSINDISVIEGNSGPTIMNFTVSLSQPSGQTVTVNYNTADGVAKAPGDYTSKAGTLTFTTGQTTKTISIVINGNTVVEGDETLFVLLTSAVNASIGRGRGTGTILNDDSSN